jgi:hypothetical protein
MQKIFKNIFYLEPSMFTGKVTDTQINSTFHTFMKKHPILHPTLHTTLYTLYIFLISYNITIIFCICDFVDNQSVRVQKIENYLLHL